MIYGCNTNRRRKFWERRLRRSPRLSPQNRPGRATAAVAAVRTTIDKTNARHVPTRPIRRVPRPNSMVVLPYLPVPRPLDRLRSDRQDCASQLRQHKTRSSCCFVFWPPATPGVVEKTRAGSMNVSVDGSRDRLRRWPNLTRSANGLPDRLMTICIDFTGNALASPRMCHYMSHRSGHLVTVGRGSEFSWPIWLARASRLVAPVGRPMPTTQSPLWCRARCWRRFSSASLTHDSVSVIDSYHGTSSCPILTTGG
jgi:hypothetical protein